MNLEAAKDKEYHSRIAILNTKTSMKGKDGYTHIARQVDFSGR